MCNGIPAVVRHNNSLHHWSGGGTQQHSIVLSTLTASLLSFTACAFLPEHQVKKKLFGTPYELQQSAVKTAD
jgi:hypothetical protein